MMKLDEHGVRGAMDRRLSALESTADRRRAIRLRAGEEKPFVKKKLTAGVVAVLALMLALTGAALAAGIMNLFEYFGRNDRRLAVLADSAVLETQRPQTVETEALGTTVGVIRNAYYDGQSLLVAYSIANGSRVEPFTPTEEMPAGAEMERIEYVPGAETPEEETIIGNFVRAKERGEPCGLKLVSVYPADHSYGNGVDLEAWTEQEETAQDGSRYMLREYETPLPEAVQNLDVLEVRMDLREQTTYLWFDGEQTWVIRGEHRKAGAMTAAVARSEAVSRCFAGAGEVNGIPVQVSAQVSAVRGELVMTGAGAFPKPENGRYDFELYDGQGNRYRLASAVVNSPDDVTLSFFGSGELPGELSIVICIENEYDSSPKSVFEPIVLKTTE